MNYREKHRAVIIAWANGAKIQFRQAGTPEWYDMNENEMPHFNLPGWEYRAVIEPEQE